MCGRYTQTADLRALLERFRAESRLQSLGARYNIAPSQEAPVVLAGKSRELVLMRWGLVPSWAQDPAIGSRMINARAETLAERPAFREPFARRRCLVPADGFYEWRRIAGSRAKVPMRFVLKGGEPFAFAGLWDAWRDHGGREINTFAIVTTQANDLLKPVHGRMPVILRPEDEDAWLDPGFKDPGRLSATLRPFPAGLMEGCEVSPRVNSPKNDDPGCVRAEPAGRQDSRRETSA